MLSNERKRRIKKNADNSISYDTASHKFPMKRFVLTNDRDFFPDHPHRSGETFLESSFPLLDYPMDHVVDSNRQTSFSSFETNSANSNPVTVPRLRYTSDK